MEVLSFLMRFELYTLALEYAIKNVLVDKVKEIAIELARYPPTVNSDIYPNWVRAVKEILK